MAKKPQPKISEMIEVLIPEIQELKKEIIERNETLENSIQNSICKVFFDHEKFAKIQKGTSEDLKRYSEDFKNKMAEINLEAAQSIERKYSKERLYLIIWSFLQMVVTSAVTIFSGK